MHCLLVCMIYMQHGWEQIGLVKSRIKAREGIHALLLEQVDILQQPVKRDIRIEISEDTD